MTYTKLKKEVDEDGNEGLVGLTSYCKNCGWIGDLDDVDNSIYKRNYEEDFIADKIVTNKYTIFDVTLPRVEYDCTNNNCITNMDIDKDKSLIVSNIPADISDDDFIKIFHDDIEKGNVIDIRRIKLTAGVLICKDIETYNEIMKKYNNVKYDSDTTLVTSEFNNIHKEVLYLKYDNINMKYLYICANCGTSWKKN
jgi:hypothetical protein